MVVHKFSSAFTGVIQVPDIMWEELWYAVDKVSKPNVTHRFISLRVTDWAGVQAQVDDTGSNSDTSPTKKPSVSHQKQS